MCSMFYFCQNTMCQHLTVVSYKRYFLLISHGFIPELTRIQNKSKAPNCKLRITKNIGWLVTWIKHNHKYTFPHQSTKVITLIVFQNITKT